MSVFLDNVYVCCQKREFHWVTDLSFHHNPAQHLGQLKKWAVELIIMNTNIYNTPIRYRHHNYTKFDCMNSCCGELCSWPNVQFVCTLSKAAQSARQRPGIQGASSRSRETTLTWVAKPSQVFHPESGSGDTALPQVLTLPALLLISVPIHRGAGRGDCHSKGEHSK